MMSPHSVSEPENPSDQSEKIIEMIFLASDLVHSCQTLEYDKRGVTKELVKCVNKSVALLKQMLADSERDHVERMTLGRLGLYAIPGGIE